MQTPDVLVILAYIVGLFVVGGIYGGKVKTTTDLFTACLLYTSDAADE